METIKETIKKAMEILKSVEKKSNFDLMLEWETSNGYDPKFDQQMKDYFATINPIVDQELRAAMSDIWNATLTYYYYTEPLNDEDNPELMSDEEKIEKIILKEGLKRSVLRYEIVSTQNGRRALLIMKDGTKKLRKIELPTKKQILNFEACEKELQDLAELGTHDYRSALAKLLEKYAA